MSIVKTHTGTVITKYGPQQKLLHETPSMWVSATTKTPANVILRSKRAIGSCWTQLNRSWGVKNEQRK